MNRPSFSLLAAALLAFAGCKAGPSAFDRGQEQMAASDGGGMAVAANVQSTESVDGLEISGRLCGAGAHAGLGGRVPAGDRNDRL